MKEEKIVGRKFRALEEGLQQETQECRKKFIHKISLCKQWITYLQLILLLELILFLAGSCYVILQMNSSRVTDNEVTDITPEKYLSIFDSVSEAQKSRPNTETPVIFVKPKILADKLNNLLEDMGLVEDKTIDAGSKSVQNSISVESGNTVRASDVNILQTTSFPEYSGLDEESLKISMPGQISSTGYIDKIISDENARSVQFLKKLRDIAKIEAQKRDIAEIETDLKEELRGINNFIENTNHLNLDLNSQELNSQEDALGMSNKLEVTAISNLEDSINRKISVNLINNLEDWKQKFSNFINDATQNSRSEENSFHNKIDEQTNESLESEYVLCPPYQSDESSDVSSESSTKDYFSVLAQEISKQKSNEDIGVRNEDKHNVDDSNTLASSLPASASESGDPYFLFDRLMTNEENQYLSEIAAKIEADEKADEPMENIEDLPETLDNVEFSTSNDEKFQWFNTPARFTDDLQLGPVDISKSSETQSHSVLDMDKDSGIIDDFIPENKCQITIILGTLRVKCPAVNFDEGWDVTTSKTDTFDFSNVSNFGDIFYDFIDSIEDTKDQLKDELISDEFDTKLTTSQNDVPEVIAVELQKSMPNEISNSPNEEEIKQAATTVSAPIDEFDYYKELISLFENNNPQQQEHLKIAETHDFSDSEDVKTSVEINERTWKSLEETLANFTNEMTMFNNEMQSLLSYMNEMKPYLSDNDYVNVFINSKVPYSSSPDSGHEEYVASKETVENIRNREFPYNLWDNNNYRKKRMVVTTLQQVANTIEEKNKDVDVLEHLRKLFQKMEILSAFIDRLHERYLLHNKLDDDYISSELPMKVRKR